MVAASQDPLFQPWKVGQINLKHRIVLAPLTRYRATLPNETPNDLMAEYYEQRASDGGLLITEATQCAAEAGGQVGTPGCYTSEHVAGWKKVTDRVHAKGGYIFLQVWALGRANKGDTGLRVVSSGDIPEQEGGIKPIPLTKEDIKRYQQHYADTAKRAIEAGFDGIELHGAHGYLIDQFTQSSSNNRTDEYGGSIENRCRFGLETLERCAEAIGQDRVAIRLSPYGHFQGMNSPDNVQVVDHFTTEIHKRLPHLAYIHMVESRADPAKLDGWSMDAAEEKDTETLDRYRKVFEHSKTAFLSAGGYNPEIARNVVAQRGGGVVFGRHFISNPDLPYRIQHNLPLTPYDRSTFYTRDKIGYTTYVNWSQPATPNNEQA